MLIDDLVFFHGSQSCTPIDTFSTGVVKAKAGFAGLGTFEVERSGFYFTKDPRMASQFGHVFAYNIAAKKTLDLRADLSENDAMALDEKGLSSRSIDNCYEKWELFDGVNGASLKETLCSLGYDSVSYWELDNKGRQQMCFIALKSDIVEPVAMPQEQISQCARLYDLGDDLYEAIRGYQGLIENSQLANRLTTLSGEAGFKMAKEDALHLIEVVSQEGRRGAPSFLNTLVSPTGVNDLALRVPPFLNSVDCELSAGSPRSSRQFQV